jgi:hypothetical protein
LDIIRNLEAGCKKFDLPESPWIHRKDFSTLSFTTKDILINIIDKIKSIIDSKDAIFIGRRTDQKSLVDSLSILTTGPGRFSKFLPGGKWRAARHSVESILAKTTIRSNLDDSQDIGDLSKKLDRGLQI